MPTSKAPTRYTIAGSGVKHSIKAGSSPQPWRQGGYLWPTVGAGRGGKTQRRAAGRWRTRRQRQSRKTNDYSGCSLYPEACRNHQTWLMGYLFNSGIQQDTFIWAPYTTTANRPPRMGSLLSSGSLLTLFWRKERTAVMKNCKSQNRYINTPRVCAQILDCWFWRLKDLQRSQRAGEKSAGRVPWRLHCYSPEFWTTWTGGTEQTQQLHFQWWKQSWDRSQCALSERIYPHGRFLSWHGSSGYIKVWRLQ